MPEGEEDDDDEEAIDDDKEDDDEEAIDDDEEDDDDKEDDDKEDDDEEDDDEEDDDEEERCKYICINYSPHMFISPEVLGYTSRSEYVLRCIYSQRELFHAYKARHKTNTRRLTGQNSIKMQLFLNGQSAVMESSRDFDLVPLGSA